MILWSLDYDMTTMRSYEQVTMRLQQKIGMFLYSSYSVVASCSELIVKSQPPRIVVPSACIVLVMTA